MVSSKEPKYTTEDKRRAIELGKKVWPTKAARQLGFPAGQRHINRAKTYTLILLDV